MFGAFVLIALTVGPAVVEAQNLPQSRTPGKGDLPVKGRLEGSVTPTLLPDNLFRWEISAAGTLTNLGQVKAAIVFPKVEVDTARRVIILRSGTWTGTLTAASGDQLYGRYTVRNERLVLDGKNHVVFVADLEITGGTGRFNGATGSGVAQGKGNLPALSFALTIDGKIAIRREAAVEH